MRVLAHGRATALAAARGLCELTARGVDLATLGLLSLVTLPYVLKVLWSPLMDRWRPPILGPRRGWLLMMQVLLVVAIAALGAWGSAASPRSIAVAAVLIAFFSASQDIVADGYRTELLRPGERGYGAALFVTGYRIAMVASGAGASVLVGQGWISWGGAYVLMAAVMAACIVGTLLADEPDEPPPRPLSVYQAIVPPLAQFLARADGVLVLLFVVLFRVPDAIAGRMTVPFLKEIGVTDTQLGIFRYATGLGMTIAGTMLGGAIVGRIGLRPSLWLFGLLQAASNLGFVALALTGPKLSVLIAVLVVENLCAGFAVAGFFVFLMSQCDRRFTVTQYALLSSLMALMGPIMGSWTGYAAAGLGWRGFFVMSVLASVPALALLPFIRARDHAADGEPAGFEVLSPGPAVVEAV
jgi:PAT family beta-lactamase induction signal transducer AmpG